MQKKLLKSHRSSPQPHRHPPKVNNHAGMAISDDEEDDQTNRVARIYDNPLHSGNEKRLDENEARMAISESSDNQSEIGVNPGVEEKVNFFLQSGNLLKTTVVLYSHFSPNFTLNVQNKPY